MNHTRTFFPLAAMALLVSHAPAALAAAPVFGAYARAYPSAHGLVAEDGRAMPFSADATSPSAALGEGEGSASSSRVSGSVSGYGSAGLQHGGLHSFSAADSPSHGAVGMTTMVRMWDTVHFENGQNMGLMSSVALTIDGTLTGVEARAWYRYYDGGHAPQDFFERLDYYAPAQPLSSGTTVVNDGLAIPLGTSKRFYFMELYTSAAARPGYQSVADFGNSLHFSWTLPEGVGYTSASGGFMTAVPEPGSLALLAAGLAFMAGVARRRGLAG